MITSERARSLTYKAAQDNSLTSSNAIAPFEIHA
jgi:hypothetical protein